jgi:SAM-dependent methyltransferase
LEKRSVQSLFDAIAYRYDLLNHLLSGGVDLYWRRKAVERLRSLQPRRILDVATGTADFAIAALRTGPEEIVGVDIADAMLRIGQRKLERRGLSGTIVLRRGDAERLPFADGSTLRSWRSGRGISRTCRRASRRWHALPVQAGRWWFWNSPDRTGGHSDSFTSSISGESYR